MLEIQLIGPDDARSALALPELPVTVEPITAPSDQPVEAPAHGHDPVFENSPCDAAFNAPMRLRRVFKAMNRHSVTFWTADIVCAKITVFEGDSRQVLPVEP
ncbi:hypothetical protein BGZ54_008284 [Gamsiella multidivaricata]|nr:hypothetical protein BGZ54_008284 [Gamsiella multidivaricata]